MLWTKDFVWLGRKVVRAFASHAGDAGSNLLAAE